MTTARSKPSGSIAAPIRATMTSRRSRAPRPTTAARGTTTRSVRVSGIPTKASSRRARSSATTAALPPTRRLCTRRSPTERPTRSPRPASARPTCSRTSRSLPEPSSQPGTREGARPGLIAHKLPIRGVAPPSAADTNELPFPEGRFAGRRTHLQAGRGHAESRTGLPVRALRCEARPTRRLCAAGPHRGCEREAERAGALARQQGDPPLCRLTSAFGRQPAALTRQRYPSSRGKRLSSESVGGALPRFTGTRRSSSSRSEAAAGIPTMPVTTTTIRRSTSVWLITGSIGSRSAGPERSLRLPSGMCGADATGELTAFPAPRHRPRGRERNA